MKVSVLIPVYNEALAIREVLRRVCSAPLPIGWEKEVIVVDDGSTDFTYRQIQEFCDDNPVWKKSLIVHRGSINYGKGAAIRQGLRLAQGEVILIQDGDLEYSPEDYPRLLKPFEDSEINVVYGSRFIKGPPRGMRRLNLLANYILSFAATLLYGHKLTDEATAYKVFRRRIIDEIPLTAKRFEICPELTAQMLLKGHKIFEIPISYNPRGVLDGKKIRAWDGFIALWWLLKMRIRPKPRL